MADICSGVSSFFFIGTACENIGRETVQFCTLFVSAAAYRRHLGKYGGADSTPSTANSPYVAELSSSAQIPGPLFCCN